MTDNLIERLTDALRDPQLVLPVLYRKSIGDAIKEIQRLRTLAGAVSTGESFKDIRKAAKGGDTISS